ncbi:MAG: hypothetical protein ACKO7W_19780 [Elainella sp.]
MALDTKRKFDLAIAAVATTAVTLLAAGAANAATLSSLAPALISANSALVQIQVD